MIRGGDVAGRSGVNGPLIGNGPIAGLFVTWVPGVDAGSATVRSTTGEQHMGDYAVICGIDVGKGDHHAVGLDTTTGGRVLDKQQRRDGGRTALRAVAAGARAFYAIADWAADVPRQVLERLGIRFRVPSEAAIRKVLGRVDGDTLDRVLGRHLAAATGAEDGRRVIAVDGKTIRGARTGDEAALGSGKPLVEVVAPIEAGASDRHCVYKLVLLVVFGPPDSHSLFERHAHEERCRD
jgi:hypothetical protein